MEKMKANSVDKVAMIFFYKTPNESATIFLKGTKWTEKTVQTLFVAPNHDRKKQLVFYHFILSFSCRSIRITDCS